MSESQRICCGCYNCWHCDNDGMCANPGLPQTQATVDAIDAAFDEGYDPPCFDNYRLHPEYAHPFYKHCKDTDGQEYRVLDHGMRIEYEGVVCFVTDRIMGDLESPSNKKIKATEEVSGYAFQLGNLFIPERLQMIREFSRQLRPVMEVEERNENT